MVIHDVGAKHPEHSIVAIENGHVTGRKVGDGASHVVLEQVRQADAQPSDHLSYLTKTPDGKILKSSTMYIRGRNGKVAAILGINYDISSLLMVEDAVHELIDTKDKTQGEPEKIVNVNDLLGRADRPVGRACWQARRPDEQGGQDARHRLFEPERSIPRHKVRRQDRKILRHIQIHTIFLY